MKVEIIRIWAIVTIVLVAIRMGVKLELWAGLGALVIAFLFVVVEPWWESWSSWGDPWEDKEKNRFKLHTRKREEDDML